MKTSVGALFMGLIMAVGASGSGRAETLITIGSHLKVTGGKAGRAVIGRARGGGPMYGAPNAFFSVEGETEPGEIICGANILQGATYEVKYHGVAYSIESPKCEGTMGLIVGASAARPIYLTLDANSASVAEVSDREDTDPRAYSAERCKSVRDAVLLGETLVSVGACAGTFSAATCDYPGLGMKRGLATYNILMKKEFLVAVRDSCTGKEIAPAKKEYELYEKSHNFQASRCVRPDLGDKNEAMDLCEASRSAFLKVSN